MERPLSHTQQWRHDRKQRWAPVLDANAQLLRRRGKIFTLEDLVRSAQRELRVQLKVAVNFIRRYFSQAELVALGVVDPDVPPKPVPKRASLGTPRPPRPPRRSIRQFTLS